MEKNCHEQTFKKGSTEVVFQWKESDPENKRFKKK